MMTAMEILKPGFDKMKLVTALKGLMEACIEPGANERYPQIHEAFMRAEVVLLEVGEDG